MNHSTLRLFPSTPFLENKLGPEQFADIPQKPGIYRFYDADDTLLYVGKARNLRRRLFTYKRASPGKTSRKEAALIRRIVRFEFDVLKNEKEALLTENRWIREKRPEFNHQNKHIETYYYIIMYHTISGFGLEYSMKPAVPILNRTEDRGRITDGFCKPDLSVREATVFGCFKGHRRVRIHLGSLLRLIWLTNHGITDPAYLPLHLSRNLTPKRYFLAVESLRKLFGKKITKLLTDWFTGNSPELVYGLIQLLKSRKSRFQDEYFCSLTDTLLSYYDRTLVPYGEFISKRDALEGYGLIFQEEIDDLQVHTRYG